MKGKSEELKKKILNAEIYSYSDSKDLLSYNKKVYMLAPSQEPGPTPRIKSPHPTLYEYIV